MSKRSRLSLLGLLTVLSLIVAACGPVSGTEVDSPLPPPPAEGTEPPATSSPPAEATEPPASPLAEEAVVPLLAEPLVAQAKQDLAGRLTLDQTAIRVTGVESVQWRDSSLGCPQPGMQYLQVITPGYLIRLEAAGQTYEYHSSLTQVVYCEEPEPPASRELGAQERLVATAKADLAQRTGIAESEIQVIKVEAVEWEDSSLGCPEEGKMYAQVITPGYQIILSAGGKEYDYRTDQLFVHLCEQ